MSLVKHELNGQLKKLLVNYLTETSTFIQRININWEDARLDQVNLLHGTLNLYLSIEDIVGQEKADELRQEKDAKKV